MKTFTLHSRMFAGALSLFALPLAFAGKGGPQLAKLDANGDGQISHSEFLAGANEKFAAMDTNRDGVVTTAEMDAKKMDAKKSSAHQGKHHGQMQAADPLKMMDQNGDGQVSTAEHTAHAEAMFAKMDANHDGSLSKDEIARGHEMKKKDKQY